MEQKVDEMFVCGLPYDEVVKILTIYKATQHSDAGWQEGFREGYKYAYDQFQKEVNSVVERMMHNG